MNTPALEPSLFHRLALARDLGTRGAALLRGTPNPFDATQGLVLLDLSIEVAAKAAVTELGRQTKRDGFKDLLDAIPELQARRADILAMHELRNAAQHRGTPPKPDECAFARAIGLSTLRGLFQQVKADFDTLSSVPQLESPHFREPLALALDAAMDRPADAAALANCAMRRLRGWISHFTGDALVPHEMWVFGNGLWEDFSFSAACADKRDEFLRAMLTLAAGTAMGIEPPVLLRFSGLAQGHRARGDSGEPGGFRYEHDEGSAAPTPEDVRWMVEVVARCALRFEGEWPDLVLVRADESTSPK